MNFAAILLGLIIATLCGATFHFWRGGGAGRLLLYLATSWVGFLAGHLLASVLQVSFDKVGQVHMGAGIICSFIFLGISYWLSLIDTKKKK